MNLYSDDRIHQQDFLEGIRRKTDYEAWFCGHYHKDRIDFFDGKPCIMLYDRVEEVDTLLKEAKELEQNGSSSADLSSNLPASLTHESVLG